jgi:hypothetical protein
MIEKDKVPPQFSCGRDFAVIAAAFWYLRKTISSYAGLLTQTPTSGTLLPGGC